MGGSKLSPIEPDPYDATGAPLRRQLLLAALFPLVTFGFLVILSSTSALNALALNLILERNSATAQVMASAIGQRLTNAVTPLQNVAETLATQSNNTALQTQTLVEAAPALQDYAGGVMLLNPAGQVVATTPGHETYVGRDFSRQAEVQQALRTGGPAFSGLIRDEVSGQMGLRIVLPVLGQGPAPVTGFLLAIIQMQDATFIKTVGLQGEPHLPGQSAYLVDGAETILYDLDRSQLGQQATSDPSLVQLIQKQQAGSLLSEVPGSRDQVIIAYVPLPAQGWGLMMEEPMGAALSPLMNYQGTLALLIVLGVVLSLSMLSLSINRLTRPLVLLSAQAEQLVPGSTFRPQKAEGPRELRQLVRAFNQMVIRLAEQQGALRDYAVQVLQSQEEERRRIARDLHDETVQDLVGLIQRIELCGANLGREPAATRQRLNELRLLAEGALADARHTARDLRSPVLDDLGLCAALEGLCEELHDLAPGIQMRYFHEGAERRLAPEAELAFYRIVQEALTNVRRHASQATQVEVRLSFCPEQVTARVTDNGPGFVVPGPQALMRAGHLGLMGMLERARLIGAQLSIQSAQGQGMTITLRL